MRSLSRLISLLLLPAAAAVALLLSGRSARPPAPPPALSASSQPASPLPRPFDEKADARKDIAAALARARVDGKRVLVEFGANWCPDCIALARLLDDPAVRPVLTAHFHPVKVNIGRRDENTDLCEQYGSPIEQGIPSVVVLSPDGRVLGSTRRGELANARTATAQEILAFLRQWATPSLPTRS